MPGYMAELQPRRGPRDLGVLARVRDVLAARALHRRRGGHPRRRKVPITPLVAQFVVVTVTAVAIYGLVRFRIPAEVSIVVLSAVAVDRLARSPSRDGDAAGRTIPGRDCWGQPATLRPDGEFTGERHRSEDRTRTRRRDRRCRPRRAHRRVHAHEARRGPDRARGRQRRRRHQPHRHARRLALRHRRSPVLHQGEAGRRPVVRDPRQGRLPAPPAPEPHLLPQEVLRLPDRRP